MSQDKIYGVYTKSLLEKKVILDITEIGSNIKKVLEDKLVHRLENRCIEEGYVKSKSIQLITYSSGNVDRNKITFVVTFDCMICHPVEGQLIECKSKNITKAGVRAIVEEGENTPLHIFIAKDHHVMDRQFNTIKEDTTIVAKVIGIRYELNDPYICCIAKLADNREKEKDDKPKQKKRIKVMQ